MVIVTIDSNTPLYITAKLMRLFGFSLAYKRLYDPHHLNHFSKKNLLRLAKNADQVVCFSNKINVALKTLDIPSSNILEDIFYKLGVLSLFAIGSIFGNLYLQIHVFKKKN